MPPAAEVPAGGPSAGAGEPSAAPPPEPSPRPGPEGHRHPQLQSRGSALTGPARKGHCVPTAQAYAVPRGFQYVSSIGQKHFEITC